MPEVKGFHDNKNLNTNTNILYLKKGITELRVLPAYSESGRWFREIKEIPLRNAEGRYSPMVSPSTIGKPCPFVEEGKRWYDMGGEENIDKAKKFRPRTSFLFNVVVVTTPDGIPDANECVKVLKCGIKVFRQILDLDQDYGSGWGDVTNLEKGFNLRISRTGEGLNTEYTVKAARESTNILDYLDKIGFSQELSPHNLDDMFAPASYEELKPRLGEILEETQVAPPVTDPFKDLKETSEPEIQTEGPTAPPLPASK